MAARPDPHAYVERMLERFRNPRIAHPLRQIAGGAEHKIAQRLLPAAEELRAAGREPRLIERVVAAAGVPAGPANVNDSG